MLCTSFGRGFLVGQKLTSEARLHSRELQGSSGLYLSGTAACTTLDLFWVLRIELRSLCLSSKHLTNGASLFPSQQVLFQSLCMKVSFVFTKIMKRLCKINSLFFLFSIFASPTKTVFAYLLKSQENLKAAWAIDCSTAPFSSALPLTL